MGAAYLTLTLTVRPRMGSTLRLINNNDRMDGRVYHTAQHTQL